MKSFKGFIIVFSISTILFACNKIKVNYQIGENSSMYAEIKPNSIKITQIKDGPSRLFLSLADTLNKSGWVNDTSLAKKKNIYRLKNNELLFYNGLPFYKLNPRDHKLYLWQDETYIPKAQLIDYKAFEKVQKILLYYYHKETYDNYMPEGFIEQWSFADSIDAKTVYENLQIIYPLPYFNTNPYYLQRGKNIYVLSTHTMMFSYFQTNHYNLLKELDENLKGQGKR